MCKERICFLSLPCNGEVTKMIWPLVTERKIPRYRFCRYWYPYYPLYGSCWSLKNYSRSAIKNVFGGWVTWPDLVIWPAMTLSWNFQEGWGKHALKGMQKTAALRAAVCVFFLPNTSFRKPNWFWQYFLGVSWLIVSKCINCSNNVDVERLCDPFTTPHQLLFSRR